MRLRRPIQAQATRRPLVEVVVPCYNYGRYLDGCVSSILDQPGVQTRVTIVDDCSTDDSAAVADRLAQTHSGVRLLRNETNQGAVLTFNRGLSQADSDYVVLISADDLLAPGALQRATALMEALPRTGLVYGHAQKFATRPVAHRGLPVTWTTWRGEEWISTQLHRAWNSISSPEAVVRTGIQHAAGYYDPGLRHTHDVEMWLRIAALADVGHINGVDQAYYRRQPDSHSSRFSTFQDIEERWRAYDQFLAGWSDRERARRLRPVVQERLAREALSSLLDDLEAGDGEPAQTAAVLALVTRIMPDAARLDAWADVQSRVDAEPPRHPAALARGLQRSLARATGWRRWHRVRPLG